MSKIKKLLENDDGISFQIGDKVKMKQSYINLFQCVTTTHPSLQNLLAGGVEEITGTTYGRSVYVGEFLPGIGGCDNMIALPSDELILVE